MNTARLVLPLLLYEGKCICYAPVPNSGSVIPPFDLYVLFISFRREKKNIDEEFFGHNLTCR